MKSAACELILNWSGTGSWTVSGDRFAPNLPQSDSEDQLDIPHSLRCFAREWFEFGTESECVLTTPRRGRAGDFAADVGGRAVEAEMH